jgi:hypothetical protein
MNHNKNEEYSCSYLGKLKTGNTKTIIMQRLMLSV